jgi:hypothetical protein
MEQNGRSGWVCPIGSDEVGAEDAGDVFKEHDCWLCVTDSVEDGGEEVSLVFVSLSSTCDRERLTWEAAREDVHLSVKVFEWEGAHIRPYRCEVQSSCFHLRDQISHGECVDLTVSDCAKLRDCCFKSEINASVPGTKAEVCNGFGRIHMIHSSSA